MADNLKIGFLGGTFDPFHNGHLNLAIELSEKEGLDQVIFCPANISPHKTENGPKATPEQRLEMAKIALSGIPKFRVIDTEIKREGVSYTVDTIRELKEQMPEASFFLLLGEDAEEKISTWKDVENLLKLARPLIGRRNGIHSLDISSTQLRERLRKRAYCAHLMPSSVLDYIYAKDLYLRSL